MDAHGIFEEPPHTVAEPAGSVIPVDLIVNIPVTEHAHLTMSHRQRMAGQELMYALEKAPVPDRVLESQVFGERVRIRRDLRQDREQSFDFRSEIEHSLEDGVVEGLDAETIAGSEELVAIPEREGK